jgi:hypothetical protein
MKYVWSWLGPSSYFGAVVCSRGKLFFVHWNRDSNLDLGMDVCLSLLFYVIMWIFKPYTWLIHYSRGYRQPTACTQSVTILVLSFRCCFYILNSSLATSDVPLEIVWNRRTGWTRIFGIKFGQNEFNGSRVVKWHSIKLKFNYIRNWKCALT